MLRTCIRFYKNVPVRNIWDEDNFKWWICAVDVIEALGISVAPRNYWSNLKNKNLQLALECSQLMLNGKDGKKRKVDVLDDEGVKTLVSILPYNKSGGIVYWVKMLGVTPAERSRFKAYSLFENGIINDIEVGTLEGLKQIHAYIFGGLCDFAGEIRQTNISKNGFDFTSIDYLEYALEEIEQMRENDLENILKKYIEMNNAHPFIDGSCRATRIWLDIMLRKNLSKCVDWSLIGKTEYLDAMKQSASDFSKIYSLIENALTDKVADLETYMKGIDYSYHYAEHEEE